LSLLTTHNTDIHAPGGIFFVFSFTLHFIRTWFFVFIVLHFTFCLCLQHTTQTSMPPSGFEAAIPASDRPHTLALDRWDRQIRSRYQSVEAGVNYNGIFGYLHPVISTVDTLYNEPRAVFRRRSLQHHDVRLSPTRNLDSWCGLI
jgi:hypothetical protein